jgi:GntR family transcriptional regulator
MEAAMSIQFHFKPDAGSPTPLYLQLADKLSDGISSGFWRHNEALPSERRLAEALGVARSTARCAIDLLCARGMVSRRRGSGCYVRFRFEQPLARLTNFSRELSARGFAPGSQWLSREIGPAKAEERRALDLRADEQVARLRRLRTADGVVMAIESSTLPARILPDPGAVAETLYGYLDVRGVMPVRVRQTIRAVNATAEQARLVGLAPGTAMLHVARVGYLDGGAAIELSHSWCRGDYYDFVAEMCR